MTAEELRGLIESLASTPAAVVRDSSLLQLASAVLASLEGADVANWDTLSRQERHLMLLSAEGASATVPPPSRSIPRSTLSVPQSQTSSSYQGHQHAVVRR